MNSIYRPKFGTMRPIKILDEGDPSPLIISTNYYSKKTKPCIVKAFNNLKVYNKLINESDLSSIIKIRRIILKRKQNGA
jgi:hypothetical protein